MKNASYCVSYGKERGLQQNEQKSSFCYSPFFCRATTWGARSCKWITGFLHISSGLATYEPLQIITSYEPRARITSHESRVTSHEPRVTNPTRSRRWQRQRIPAGTGFPRGVCRQCLPFPGPEQSVLYSCPCSSRRWKKSYGAAGKPL